MDALESLCTQPLSGSHRNFSVVFLGRSLKVELQNEIALRANSSSWCFSWKILDDLDMTHARQFLLSSPKFTTRFAVIPSFMDNLPYTLMECIELNIPFIASDVGGNRELLNPSDIRRVLFQPTKVHLARRLWEILNLKEPWILPRLSVSQHRIIEVWDLWHCSLPPANQDKRSTSNMRRTPLVSVIIPTHNPTRFLADAIASISAQTYQNFEIIVVNDGSTDEPAMQLLNQLSKQAKQEKRQWKFIDIENSYVGAARNAGVQYAHGEYILFMDDDNVAKANELEIFVHVALRTQVDILTCLVDVFEGNDTFLEISQADMKHVITRWLPLGNAGASGVFNNRFGDANMFVSRTAFLELEGFSTDFGIGFEDWEFLARASLRGFRIDVVPEALFWKRERPNSMTDTISSKESTMRALRPYFYYTPHFFRLPLLLAHNLLQMKPLIVIRSEQAFSCIPGHYGWYLGLSNKTFHGISALEFHANVTISVPEQSEVRCGYSGANSDLIPSYAQVTRNMMHPVGSNTRIGPLRAVHRWVSFLEGKFLWKATLGVDASCGDGVELQLRIDGDLKWNRKIQAHEEMFTVSFPFAAVPGTVTEFIVDPIGNDWCDSVRHTIEIAHITDL
jgi:glycosyltransferase involved in cell wall biosynthesis